jgi:hypothetical protein
MMAMERMLKALDARKLDAWSAQWEVRTEGKS